MATKYRYPSHDTVFKTALGTDGGPGSGPHPGGGSEGGGTVKITAVNQQ